MTHVMWMFVEDGRSLVLGESDDGAGGGTSVILRVSHDLGLAKRWAMAFRAGRLPTDDEDAEPTLSGEASSSGP